ESAPLIPPRSLHDALPICWYRGPHQWTVDGSGVTLDCDLIEDSPPDAMSQVLEALATLSPEAITDAVHIAEAMVSSRDDLDAKRSEEHTSELQSRENLVCR